MAFRNQDVAAKVGQHYDNLCRGSLRHNAIKSINGNTDLEKSVEYDLPSLLDSPFFC